MNDSTEKPFREWVRLEQPRLGTRVVAASDEFFGAKERLIEPADPVFVADRYDEHGKWMDGWESRRRRTPGHDWCVIRLGLPSELRGLEIDTRHFTGNYPPEASVDVASTSARLPGVAAWTALTRRIPLKGDRRHFLAVEHDSPVTHLRLNIFPDGGVARFRIYGAVRPDWTVIGERRIDLFALEHGGRALACSDEHFGSMHNLNLRGRGINMGDGWETARRRGAGHDWVVVALGHRGVVDEAVVDTAHFKGNYPDAVELRAADAGDADLDTLLADSGNWPLMLGAQKLAADSEQRFTELEVRGPVTHLRMSIFPDGGVSRLRLLGRAVKDP